MPRQARIDSPGLLHHVIARGIERRTIFRNSSDYRDFLERLPSALSKSPNQIYAWALMPNHLHLLVRSGSGGLSGFMRRLMTGYAVAFNHRHKRSGYLFQNRYKSIVCEEETYLLELVRYIHLNPVRAGLVKSMDDLNDYPYTGHSALMGKISRVWQETDEILSRFGPKLSQAQKKYAEFLFESWGEKKRRDLTGGGLLRSAGGWENVLSLKKGGDRQQADARILGSGDFVGKTLAAVEEDEKIKRQFKKQGSLPEAAAKIARRFNIAEEALYQKGRTDSVSKAKAVLIYTGVDYFGKTVKYMAGATRMSVSAASKAKERGRKLAEGPMLN